MNTPLYDAVRARIGKDFSRFHMPGHKGTLDKFDITELAGLESLYEGAGAISGTESLFSEIYGTKASLLSAGGSTLCIQTMLALACPPGSKVVAARGVHVSAVNAMALLDLHPVWIMPGGDVRKALAENPDAKAVCITSPSYYGIISDIAGIASACREFGIPLLCDNAHGAHLKFLPEPMHPMDLGADICCDSLHKTLPALTGAALLHIQNEKFIPGAKRAMSIFGSTSPSFPVLLSADLLLSYLADGVHDDMRALCKVSEELRKTARESGFTIPGGILSPLHLTLGYCREDFISHLESHKITPEYIDSECCVLLLGSRNTERDFERLRTMIKSAKHVGARPPARLPLPLPEQTCSVREATFARSHEIPIETAIGETAAGMVTACPPGIPVLIPGERISREVAIILKNSGILSVSVIYL